MPSERAESLAQRAGHEETGPASFCGLLQEGIIRTYIAPEGAAEQLGPSPSRRCPSCSREATTSRCAPCTGRADVAASGVAGRTLRGTRTTWQRFTRGAPASSTSTWAGVRYAASTGRPPSSSSSRGSTPTSHEPAAITGIAPRGRWPLRGRRLRRSTRAVAARGGARGARRKSSPRRALCDRVEHRGATRRRCCRRRGVRSTRLQRARAARRRGVPLESAARLAQALYRLDRLDEAHTGHRARPSSARATTPRTR